MSGAIVKAIRKVLALVRARLIMSARSALPRSTSLHARVLAALGGPVALSVFCIATDLRAATVQDGPCRLRGVSVAMRCGHIDRAEDPDRPDGRQISIAYAVLPALATPALADPVFVLAGGPGQSARSVAGPISALLGTLNTRRDLVFVDQRGTGASAPLACPREAGRTIEQALDLAAEPKRMQQCLNALSAQDKVDLRQYATWIAVQDFDAVRAHLGYAHVNLFGASYGTRVALEWMRQYPGTIRSAALDGVAPPDMSLPASLARDASAALDTVFTRCKNDASCARLHPDLASDFERLLARSDGLISATVPDAITGQRQSIGLDRRRLVSLLRAPLYVPTLSAVLPYALAQAAEGNLAALAALSSVLGEGLAENFAEAMHFAVVCAEDLPRIDSTLRAQAAASRFGAASIALYEDVCSAVPVRPVPAAFYEIRPPVGAAVIPTLLLSGGVDPVTPPRHGDAVAAARTGALHLVAPNIGHGVLTSVACAADLVSRFVRTASVVGLDGGCLQRVPAPRFFAPPRNSLTGPS